MRYVGSIVMVVLGLVLLASINNGSEATGAASVAQQPAPSKGGVCPKFFLRDEAGNIINPLADQNTEKPYSPKQTCGRCHDYKKITSAYHFMQGKGEAATDTQKQRVGWAQSPGNYGGSWCSPAPLYKYLSPKENDSPRTMDMTSQSFLMSCGGCHPGGGPAEYDREGHRYDEHMASGAVASGGENGFDGDYYKTTWDKTGVLEADCLLCHMPEYASSKRNKAIKAGNFRWSATAGAGFAAVSGKATEETGVQMQWNSGLFDSDGKVDITMVRSPRNTACLGCHDKPGYKKRGANYRNRTDVHARAGLRCVDCHPAGSSASDARINSREDHNIGKGNDPGGLVRNDLDNTMLSCSDCHDTGRMGAPVARHAWLPPLHMDAIACQTCHIPQRSVKSAQVVASDVFNPGNRIPTKGKHLWTFYGPDMQYWNHYGDLELMGFDDKPTHLFTPNYVRYEGKIYPANRIHTAWPAIQTPGQSALMQPKMGDIYKMWMAHKKDASRYPALAKIRDDNGDDVPEINRAEEIQALIDSVTAYLKDTGYPLENRRVVWVNNDRAYYSGTQYDTIPKNAWEASPYGNVHLYNHDIYPAKAALGANGCTDCHRDDAPMFFAPTVKYPFDDQAMAVTEPQYKVLGIDGIWARLGAWREQDLKPGLLGLLAILLSLLAGQGIGLGLRQAPLRGVARHGHRLGLVAAGAMMVICIAMVQAAPQNIPYMFMARRTLDGNHFLFALVVMATAGISLAMGYREMAKGKGKTLVLWGFGIALALVALSGLGMIVKPPVEALYRLTYTIFEIGLLALVLMGCLTAGYALLIPNSSKHAR